MVSRADGDPWQGTEVEYAVDFKELAFGDRAKHLAHLMSMVAGRERAAGEAPAHLDYTGSGLRPPERSAKGGRRWTMKHGCFMRNGSRVYLDTIGPWDERRQILEVCTPECPSATHIVAYERTLDEMVVAAAVEFRSQVGDLHVYRAAHVDTPWGVPGTVGLHESYSVPAMDIKSIAPAFVPFLAVRQLLCGTGGFGEGEFRISPRQGFLRSQVATDLSWKHSFLSEGHSNYAPAGTQRVQVLNGEAARGELTTFLRQAVTWAVLAAVAGGQIDSFPEAADPAATARQISSQPFGPWTIALADGSREAAIDFLRDRYLLPCLAIAKESSEEEFALRTALEVLAHLESGSSDPGVLSIDWLVKRAILYGVRDVDGSTPGTEWIKSSSQEPSEASFFDNAYRAITDPLFAEIEASWQLTRLTDETSMRRARAEPPLGSRASVRLAVLEKYGHRISSLSWDRATIDDSDVVFSDLAGWTSCEVDKYVSSLS